MEVPRDLLMVSDLVASVVAVSVAEERFRS